MSVFDPTLPASFGDCSSCTPCGPITIRTLTARCTGGNDGVNANMLAWLNVFDMSVMPAASQWIYDFSDASLTSPDSGPFMYSPGFSPPAVSKWDVIKADGSPQDVADGWRSQIQLPVGSKYGVIAFTIGDSMGWFACVGTVMSGESLIELPVPNDSLAGGAPFNRMFYWFQAGVNNSTDLEAFWAVIQPTTTYVNGGTWDITATCEASPDDPFDGDIP